MHLKKLPAMVFALICLSPLTLATATESAHSSGYINATISPEFLAMPPTPKSAEWLAEVDQIIKLQASVTPEEVKKAESESELDLKFFLPALGKDFDPAKFPHTYTLLEKSGADCRHTVGAAKDFWKTERPYIADKRIKPLITPPGSYYAYPSGHTACSRIWAEVAGQVVPAKREALRQRAAEIAHHRVIGGMHWPHDVTGGEQLAMILFGALQASPAYQDDLSAAKKEWAK